jgi:hypothetical protein
VRDGGVARGSPETPIKEGATTEWSTIRTGCGGENCWWWWDWTGEDRVSEWAMLLLKEAVGVDTDAGVWFEEESDASITRCMAVGDELATGWEYLGEEEEEVWAMWCDHGSPIAGA